MITDLYPSSLALIRTRINGFATLKPDDQLRAAAFALKRELGIDANTVKLAVRLLDAADDVAIAYAPVSNPPGFSACPATFFDAMRSNDVYWFGAPNGIAVGPNASVIIELHEPAHELPNEIVTLLAAHGAPTQVVLREAVSGPDEGTLAHWSAATGARFSLDDTSRVLSGHQVPLVSVSHAAVVQARSRLDRALLAACAASVVCAVLAGLHWARLPALASSPVASGKVTESPGNTFTRIATISPELIRTMKSATYGGGAWIIGLNARVANGPAGNATGASVQSAALVTRAASALQSNGLAVQVVTEPEPRIRVQAP